MNKTSLILAWSLLPALLAAETGPLPKDVIKAKEEGTVPTSVWLAECEGLFEDFLSVRYELDSEAAAGAYADDPAAYARALNQRTVPRAQALAEFCSAFIPDTKWGQQLRLEVIDAMVSSLAADAHVVEILGGEAQSRVPLAEMLAEQKEMSDSLIAEVHQRLLDAPKKYRAQPEKLAPSRDYYFQSFHLRGHPGK